MPERHDRTIPFASGEAIRHWQLSEIAQARYDVPPRPMHSDMDPFFFLTKHNNLIPDEYPCRWDFVRDFPNQQPIPTNGEIQAEGREIASTAKP